MKKQTNFILFSLLFIFFTSTLSYAQSVTKDPEFDNHSQVINGFSDLMVEVFGEDGKHARSAIGLGSLPRNIPVEIEMIVEMKD